MFTPFETVTSFRAKRGYTQEIFRRRRRQPEVGLGDDCQTCSLKALVVTKRGTVI